MALDTAAEPVVIHLPGGEVVEMCTRCARPGCGAGYLPRDASHRYCSAACRIAVRDASPARRAGVARRGAAFYAANASYRAARRALLRAGIDPATVPELYTLRRRGVVEGWREVVGLPPVGRTARPAPQPRAAPDPWCAPAPAWPSERLPHGAVTLRLDGLPRALRWSDARHLHALVTTLCAVPHTGVADWALYPYGDAWAVQWRSAEHVRASLSRDARLGAYRVTATLGPLVRLRAPALRPPGRYRVRVTALTPVVSRSMGSTRTHSTPVASTLAGSLVTLARALGLDVADDAVALEIVDAETVPTRDRVTRGSGPLVGGDGRLRGWEGTVTVETSALGVWLLEIAARGWGLGGRVAFGCGRVRVEVL